MGEASDGGCVVDVGDSLGAEGGESLDGFEMAGAFAFGEPGEEPGGVDVMLGADLAKGERGVEKGGEKGGGGLGGKGRRVVGLAALVLGG